MSIDGDGTDRATAQQPPTQGVRPPAPASTTPWGVALGRGVSADDDADSQVPVPIEGEDGDIVSPVPPPDAGEVFPASSGARTPAYLDLPTEEQAEPPTTTSGFQILGSIAATNASLSASGAPTPVAGIPVRPIDTEVPDLDAGEAFVPTFRWDAASAPASADHAGDGVDALPPVPAQFEFAAPTLATPQLSTTPQSPATAPSPPTAPVSFDDLIAPTNTEPDYQPRVPAMTATDTPPPTIPPATDEQVPWWRSTPALVALGLVVMAGIGYAVYLLFFEPDNIELPHSTVVVTPDSTAPEPITPDTDSAFVAALPATTLTHAMASVEQVELRDIPGLEVRTAEAWDVVYTDGTSQVTVRALQHYTEEEATRAWDGFTADAESSQPVTVGTQEVGRMATLETEQGTTVVWRNATTVFMAWGEGDVAEFVRLYPY